MNLSESAEIAEALGAALGKRAGRRIGRAIAKAIADGAIAHREEIERAILHTRAHIAGQLRERQRQGFTSTDELFQAFGDIANDVQRMSGDSQLDVLAEHMAVKDHATRAERERIIAWLRNDAISGSAEEYNWSIGLAQQLEDGAAS